MGGDATVGAAATEEAVAVSAATDGTRVTVEAAAKEEAAAVRAATEGTGLRRYIEGWSTWGKVD